MWVSPCVNVLEGEMFDVFNHHFLNGDVDTAVLVAEGVRKGSHVSEIYQINECSVIIATTLNGLKNISSDNDVAQGRFIRSDIHTLDLHRHR